MGPKVTQGQDPPIRVEGASGGSREGKLMLDVAAFGRQEREPGLARGLLCCRSQQSARNPH